MEQNALFMLKKPFLVCSSLWFGDCCSNLWHACCFQCKTEFGVILKEPFSDSFAYGITAVMTVMPEYMGGFLQLVSGDNCVCYYFMEGNAKGRACRDGSDKHVCNGNVHSNSTWTKLDEMLWT